MNDDFARFEHEGWERVAHKYDSVWSSVTRQFIPYLVNAAEVAAGMSVLDVACGPGYVSDAVRKAGGIPKGIDFSGKMIAIAKTTFPDLFFIQGDAQNLPFEDAGFDRVLINFGLLHLSDPEKGCAEACRVLKSGGKFGFTVWAGPDENPGARIVNDAIEAHADLDVGLPEGPPHYLYGDRHECQKVLEQAGFDGNSMNYDTRTVEWSLPNASHFFMQNAMQAFAPPGFSRASRQKSWTRFASQLKMASSDMPEEAKSYCQWLRAWLSCRRRKGDSPVVRQPTKDE